MIGKLYKHDIKKMTKTLVWFYLLSLGLAGITRLVNIGSHIQFVNIIGKVLQGMTFSAIANILINMVIHVLLAFSRGFYKDESYLTHTLPVTKTQLFTSKFLAGTTVIVCSLLVSFLSLFILFYTKDLFNVIKAYLQMSIVGLEMSGGAFVILLVFALIVELLCMMAMAFTAIIKCNTYNTKRIIKGVVWFVVYYMVAAIINLLSIVIVFALSGNISEISATVMSGKAFVSTIVMAFVDYLVFTIAHFFIANKIFNRGVNVD